MHLRALHPILAEQELPAYRPRPAIGFEPVRIVLAQGSDATPWRRRVAEAICAAYPQAERIEAFDVPHNRIRLGPVDALGLHYEGKRTLVLAEHGSSPFGRARKRATRAPTTGTSHRMDSAPTGAFTATWQVPKACGSRQPSRFS